MAAKRTVGSRKLCLRRKQSLRDSSTMTVGSGIDIRILTEQYRIDRSARKCFRIRQGIFHRLTHINCPTTSQPALAPTASPGETFSCETGIVLQANLQ